MKLNNKQKYYLIILISFIIFSVLYELGYFLIKKQIDLKHTPFIVVVALIAVIIGVIRYRNK